MYTQRCVCRCTKRVIFSKVCIQIRLMPDLSHNFHYFTLLWCVTGVSIHLFYVHIMCISMWAGECNTIYTQRTTLGCGSFLAVGFRDLTQVMRPVRTTLSPVGPSHCPNTLSVLASSTFRSQCGFSRSPSYDCWLERKSWWGILTTCIMNHNAEETTRVTDWSWDPSRPGNVYSEQPHQGRAVVLHVGWSQWTWRFPEHLAVTAC